MKLAITTDWLITSGGAERVIDEMRVLWPEAPVFTTVHKPSTFNIQHSTITTSSLQLWYNILGNHRLLLPLMPGAVESWDLRGYDVILSSSHAVAKGCIPPSSARHICYCHTPMRYAWEMEEEYLDDFKLWGPMRQVIKWQLRKLREWDYTTSKRVDRFIANSNTVAERIARLYGRESIVLPPPVDDRFFEDIDLSSRVASYREPACPSIRPYSAAASMRPTRDDMLDRVDAYRGTYFLALGRLVPYKHFDLLISVANSEKLPLVIAGEGPEEERLKNMAGPTVTFLGRVPDADLPDLYKNAQALLFPVHEDAGIVPLEAQACGTPVIALGKGGTCDTVKHEETGLFFEEQTPESLIRTLQRFALMHFDKRKIRYHARQFGSSAFRKTLKTIVERSA